MLLTPRSKDSLNCKKHLKILAKYGFLMLGTFDLSDCFYFVTVIISTFDTASCVFCGKFISSSTFGTR